MIDRSVIPGSEKRRLAGATRVGAADPNEVVEVTVVLKLPGKTGSNPLAAYVSGAGARGKQLSREEFEARFSASSDDIILLEEFAREHQLDIVEVSPERRSVVLSGTVAALTRAFGTELHRYRNPSGHHYRGRSGTISMPKTVASRVQAVLGLDDRPAARPHLRRVESRSAGGALTPTEVASLYDFPADATGKGQCIAIIELGGGFSQTELRAYFKSLRIAPPKVSSVSVDGGRNQPGIDTNADGEVMLDIEVAGSVAPGANLVVYFGGNTDRAFLDAITKAIHDKHHRPSVISISWGGPESHWTEQALNAFDSAFQAAAAMGITVCAAAGDAGSRDGLDDGHQHVDFPASSPFVLACGGTRLVKGKSGIGSESAWNDGPTSATGGGISDFFDLPAWQKTANVPPSANLGARRGRGVPDVSGNADPVTGYKVLVDGQATVIGGTSAVAPLWAGLIALLNEKASAPVGYLHPKLYALKSVLRDITHGGNGAYSSRAGWDACTGLGSPNGTALAKALK